MNLTENAQASGNHQSFESLFEITFLMGAAPLGANASPPTIKKLANIRKNQLALWKQKNLPETELTRREQAIVSAGLFDAYNYWLFQGARPDEFTQWMQAHPTEFQSWKDWQSKNNFAVESPDFQRLYLAKQ